MTEPNPFLRVTVGAQVFTHDGQNVGKVGEVRARAFKVQTSLFQRDFWLLAEVVSSAAPDGGVMLAVPKADLSHHKVSEPPRAA